MKIIETFNLLKGVPNILDYDKSKLSRVSIGGGATKVSNILKLIENRINHYTKKKVFDTINNLKKEKSLVVLTQIDKYILPVTYNTPTKSIIINLQPFGTDDISRLDPRNIYACMVYGICFKELVTKKTNVPDAMFASISAFITTTIMRLFGKEFGLLGVYATQIPALKFLTTCYVLASMFGEKSKANLYKKASMSAYIDFRPYVDKLSSYDFSNINDYIKSLSDMKVMPGITRHTFAARIIKSLTVNFLPAIEDPSRFISVLTTSDLPGSSIAPTFISKYNTTEFEKILHISKRIF